MKTLLRTSNVESINLELPYVLSQSLSTECIRNVDFLLAKIFKLYYLPADSLDIFAYRIYSVARLLAHSVIYSEWKQI